MEEVVQNLATHRVREEHSLEPTACLLRSLEMELQPREVVITLFVIHVAQSPVICCSERIRRIVANSGKILEDLVPDPVTCLRVEDSISSTTLYPLSPLDTHNEEVCSIEPLSSAQFNAWWIHASNLVEHDVPFPARLVQHKRPHHTPGTPKPLSEVLP